MKRIAVGIAAFVLVSGALGWLEARARAATPRPPSIEVVYRALFGGLRAPVAAVRWLEADLDFRKGLYREAARDLRAVARITPRATNRVGNSVWDYGAWHLAFNVSKMAPDEPTRCRYIVDGYRFGRDGLAVLPDNAPLHDICAAIAAKAVACRDAFESAFGRAPEEAAWGHFLALQSVFRDDVGPRIRWSFGLSVRGEIWGQRLLLTDRPKEAQNVFLTVVESLDLTRRLAEEGSTPPGGTLFALIRERESAEKWSDVARFVASGDRGAAIRRLRDLRAAQPADAIEWIERIDEVLRHLQRR